MKPLATVAALLVALHMLRRWQRLHAGAPPDEVAEDPFVPGAAWETPPAWYIHEDLSGNRTTLISPPMWSTTTTTTRRN